MTEEKKNEEPRIGYVPFEEKQYFDGVFWAKGIFVDGELFDWGIDEKEYNEAVKFAEKQKNKEGMLLKIHQNIEKHFINSLSEFMNRKITLKELDEARKTGWIKK